MKKIAIVTGLLPLLVLAQNVRAEPSKIYEGRKLYNSNCYICHGTDGKGTGPLAYRLDTKPTDLTIQGMNGKKDTDLLRVIQGNSPHGKSLPDWKKAAINDPDAQAILTYVRFLQQSRHPLIGDPEPGRDVYIRYCVICHGEEGKGNGSMTNILDIHPADHTKTKHMDRMTNGQLVTFIARGGPVGKTNMPAWEGILTAQEIQDVASYIRMLAIKK